MGLLARLTRAVPAVKGERWAAQGGLRRISCSIPSAGRGEDAWADILTSTRDQTRSNGVLNQRVDALRQARMRATSCAPATAAKMARARPSLSSLGSEPAESIRASHASGRHSWPP